MAWTVGLGAYFCISMDWQQEVERAVERLAVNMGYQQIRRDEEHAIAHEA